MAKAKTKAEFLARLREIREKINARRAERAQRNRRKMALEEAMDALWTDVSL